MANQFAGPSAEMVSAIRDLWRIPAPGPDNLLAHPAFRRLRDLCRDSYPNAGKGGPDFALSSALRTLGIPCNLRPESTHLVRSADQAAADLDAALRATHAERIHLIPLDLASDLPTMTFGKATLGRPSAGVLRAMFDVDRLKRVYPTREFEAERFAMFHWLAVRELVALEHEPERRAVPGLLFDFRQDLGQIEPHKGQFPAVVEDALFFLLLAPWEDWSTMLEVDWRGFRTPWLYTVDSDIFVRPAVPPASNTLSWQEASYRDYDGEEHWTEVPVELRLQDDAATELLVWDQTRWEVVQKARQSILFETPIVHFLVQAFLTNGVDSFLAHITAIEAALGLYADYNKTLRVAPDRHRGLRVTDKMRGRIAGLLGDRKFADQYERLFNIRSAFLHGRTMTAISTEEQVMARSLARQVVEQLVLAADAGSISSREAYLDDLLDKGAPLSKP